MYGIPIEVYAVGLLISLTILLYLTYIEWRAYQRLKKLKEFEHKVTKPNHYDHKTAEFWGLPLGATGISVYEIYAATNNHEEALSALKHKYNRELADLDHPFGWMNYIISRSSRGEASVNSIVSNIAGQLGENEAVEMLNGMKSLQEEGIYAELIENRSNKSNDIIFKNEDGEVVTPSVDLFNGSALSSKSYGNKNDFLNAISDSEATQHIVNKELYEDLKNSGDLQMLNNEGIKVINGNWEHNELRRAGNEAVDDFEGAVNIAEDLPGVAAFFFGYRTYTNGKDLYQGKLTKEEFGAEFLTDNVRLASAGVGTFIGFKGGAAVGTIIAPGIGTFIGGGIGALSGGIGTSKLYVRFKNWFKFSTMRSYLEEISNHYVWYYLKDDSAEKKEAIRQIGATYFTVDKTYRALDDENELKLRYDQELDLYANSKKYIPPTIAGTLTRRHFDELYSHLIAAKEACENIFEEIWKFCKIRVRNDVKKAKLLFASILSDIEFTQTCTLNEFGLYKKEVEKYPNNPYRITTNTSTVSGHQLMESLLSKTYQNAKVEYERNLTGKYLWPIVLLVLLIAFFATVLISSKDILLF